MSDDEHRCEALLMRAVDGVLTDAENVELEDLLERFPGYRDELSDFQEIKETTDAMTARILTDFEREPPRPTASAKAISGVGLTLLLATTLGTSGFAAWAFFVDATIPMFFKIALGAGSAGLLLLFGRVLWLRLRGRDPYEEVDL